MRLHILGICGTFMGGVAALARELGHAVEGSDANVYPPMSTQLEALGIGLVSGYAAENLQPAPDLVVVGNAMSRGNPAVEYMLDARLRYVSGPQWLGETVLAGRDVLAVAGTHGKTTTTSLLAHLLESAGVAPGFLVGGVPGNFGVSARLGGKQAYAGPEPSSGAARHLFTREGTPQGSPRGEGSVVPPAAAPFVIEADEYDTAFFDKRSKFVHYRPRCWTPVESFGIGRGDWQATLIEADGSAFAVQHADERIGEVRWSLLGNHSVMNALAALAAATAAGADPRALLPAFAGFESVKRRMELVGEVNGVRVYDDFAHHPTAIATTLAGLRAKVGGARILVVLEPRSNSMRQGAHAAALAPSLADADGVFILQRAELPWDAGAVISALDGRGIAVPTVDTLIAELRRQVRSGDQVVFMSNGGFEAAPRRFVERLRGR